MLLILTSSLIIGQEHGLLTGSVRDSVGDPVDLANVALLGTQEGTMTRADGTFELEIPAGRHRFEGRYRPPGLLPAALVSTVAVLMALFVVGHGLKANGRSSVGLRD